ncbi:hypothetical protein C7446_0794 [Kushneria sinocarnis]|uniref:LTXXQ motif family protein n=1 Tax=Kushneria sinocarnis TaxID=595502 RepID=A0A420WZM1_9GAMM|nr:hypothetical protein [Kushneria sinocarnis]RKR06796.1 hypothetical protein C7446_0794 [Kushneria sinocarnis]
MKKLLLAAAMTTAVTATLSPLALAHDSTASADKSRARDTIYASWSLNDQQRAQLASADRTFQQRLQQLKSDNDDQTDRAAFRKAAQMHHEALAEVLDQAQLRVLEALHQRRHAGRMKGELRRALIASWHLNDDQQQALKQARERMQQDLAELRRQQFDSRADKRAAFEKIRQAQHERMAKVLDSRQLKVWAMMRHVELRGPKGNPPLAGARALVESWHLDREKQQAFDQATRDFFEQLHELKRPPHSTAGRPSQGDRQQHRQAMKDAIEHYRDRLDDLLSPAQLAALEVFAPPHHSGRGGPHGPGMSPRPPAPRDPQPSAADPS